MSPASFPTLFRYFWLVVIGVLVFNLLYGRARAAALVAAGRITQEELDGFVRGVAVLLGGFFVLVSMFQMLGPNIDPVCLMTFPPRKSAGWILWSGQAFLSAGIVWWLWARDGARVLAQLAPAFTHGSVLERRFSPRRVRLLVTAVVVIGPAGNIGIQLADPMLLAACSAV